MSDIKYLDLNGLAQYDSRIKAFSNAGDAAINARIDALVGEDGTVGYASARGQPDNTFDDEEYHHAADVEEEVDEGGALGVSSGGHTSDEGHHAGTDVGTQRQEDALVDIDKFGDDHCQRDGGHHGRALDHSGEQGADEHQQYGIADLGEKQFDGFESGEIGH